MILSNPIQIRALKRDDNFYFEKDFTLNKFEPVSTRYSYIGELGRAVCFALVDQTGYLRNPPRHQDGENILVRKVIG